MLNLDVKRLVKIDEQILEQEELVAFTIVSQSSEDAGKLFNVLRAHNYKLEKLKRMRANLIRSMGNKLSRAQTFSITLQERKLAVEQAIQERDAIEQDIVQLMAGALISGDTTVKERLNILQRALASQKLRVYNKERAVANWLAKEESTLPVKRNRPLIQKQIVDSGDIRIIRDAIRKPDMLDQDWDLKVSGDEAVLREIEGVADVNKIANTATFDILARPQEEVDRIRAEAAALEVQEQALYEQKELEKL